MNLMQMPLPREAEFYIRDTLIDELKTKTLDEIIDEFLVILFEAETEDVQFQRNREIIKKVFTHEELKQNLEVSFSKLEIHDFIKKDNDLDTSGEEPITLTGLAIAFGVGLIAGVAANLLQDWWNKDNAKKTPCYKVQKVKLKNGLCVLYCINEQGLVTKTWEIPCEGSSKTAKKK